MDRGDQAIVRRPARQVLAPLLQCEQQKEGMEASDRGVQGGASRRTSWPCLRGRAAHEAEKRAAYDPGGKVDWGLGAELAKVLLIFVGL